MPETRRPKSRLRRSVSRWANHSHDEARDLRAVNRSEGVTSILDAPDREMVTVQGTIKTVTLRPRAGIPALEAELYDGSETLVLIFLGRRRIAGIGAGRKLRVTGRIGRQHDARLMYNPRYELRP